MKGVPQVSPVLRDLGGPRRNVQSSQTSLPDSSTLPFMTEGLHRFYGGNDLHLLTFSCYRRRPLFKNEAYCDLFLKILERARRRSRLVVLGCVMMPEHVHLLVSEPQRETLSTAIQALKLGFIRSLEAGGVSGGPTSRKRSEKRGTPKLVRPSCPQKSKSILAGTIL
jgi:REP element-mobilizing transposase RayT